MKKKYELLDEINFPSDLKKILHKTSKLTKTNKKIIVNFAINYGSKTEILNALKKTKKKIDIKSFEKNLSLCRYRLS